MMKMKKKSCEDRVVPCLTDRDQFCNVMMVFFMNDVCMHESVVCDHLKPATWQDPV